jgi:hypothetical protein
MGPFLNFRWAFRVRPERVLSQGKIRNGTLPAASLNSSEKKIYDL